MIITASPLRIPIGGGGTDLPSYYRDHGGFVISAAIDKHVYINVNRRFVDRILLKYSQLEEVSGIDEIRHPLIREAMRIAGIQDRNIEITSMADIPGGTGLGSSGSFTTALLKALHTHRRNLLHPLDLAKQACHIEIDVLGEPVGKQDQYIAACGGFTCFDFLGDGSVKARPLEIGPGTVHDLEDNLLLFFTGYSRPAGAILQDQHSRTLQGDKSMIDNLHFVKELAYRTEETLKRGDTHEFARLMDIHWQHKKKRSAVISNQKINSWYDHAMCNGALGGKLIGAGGGGFLMMYAGDKRRLGAAMREHGLEEVRFRFAFEGTRVLCQD